MNKIFTSRSIIFIVFLVPAFLFHTPAKTATVYSLKNDGWRVIEQKTYVEIRPGVGAYIDLKRHIQITIYFLKRLERVYKCRVEYDSQKDSLMEKCIGL